MWYGRTAGGVSGWFPASFVREEIKGEISKTGEHLTSDMDKPVQIPRRCDCGL